MKEKKHHNSLFQVRILEPLYKYVEDTDSIPGNFKEQFVKYDDNLEDDTVIIFQPEFFLINQGIFELSIDFIMIFIMLVKRHIISKQIYMKECLIWQTLKKKNKK